MRHLLIALAVILGISIVTASSKRTEGVGIEKIENVAKVSENNSLSAAMKKASTAMRRLSRAVGSNNWVKMDMWTQELKNLIGFSCVELYMIENNNIPDEFKELSNKFNSAINKLILSCKKQDTKNTNIEFNNLVKSCDACHESYNKDAEGLNFTDPG